MLAPSDTTRSAFETWRGADANHAAAYDKVSAARCETAALAEHPTLLSLRQQTLARTMLTPRPSRIRPKAVAAAVLLLAGAPLAALGVQHWVQPKPEQTSSEIFRTGIGQQADVTLPDGSTVTLDTASRLEVRFIGDERRVRLDGQGWFKLKSSTTPFRITAGGRNFTTDQGTFDIRTDSDQVRAFAAEGQLAMTDGASSVALEPGRLLVARGNDVLIRPLDHPASFTGWRQGLLQFDNVPLAEAAGELNRYRHRQIRIADSRAATLHVSGAFHTAETSAFVDALTSGFPVRVKQDSNKGVLIASR